MSTELSKTKIHEISKILDQEVSIVLGGENVKGFERFFLVAEAMNKLQTALTDDYMKPIMALQGSSLGFKTDKTYPVDVVRRCISEAVLTGVEPVGNHFNIIAGNMYITKEGFGYLLLTKVPGLYYDIIPELPRIKDTSAAVVMNINWTLNGTANEKKVDFATKVNQYMGADAVIGKATRKARAWLYNTITGSEIPDGESEGLIQASGKTVDRSNEEDEVQRVLLHFSQCTELPKLVEAYNKCTPELQTRVEEAYQLRHQELSDIEDSREQEAKK